MADADRRNIVVPDELWTGVRRAAALQSIAEDRTVSLSEWIRDACRQRLEREQQAGQ